MNSSLNGFDCEIIDSNHQTNKRSKNDDDEKDTGLRIIDSYDRIENKIKRGIEKKKRVKKLENSLTMKINETKI